MPRFADDDGKTPLTDFFAGQASEQYDAIWQYLQSLKSSRAGETLALCRLLTANPVSRRGEALSFVTREKHPTNGMVDVRSRLALQDLV